MAISRRLLLLLLNLSLSLADEKLDSNRSQITHSWNEADESDQNLLSQILRGESVSSTNEGDSKSGVMGNYLLIPDTLRAAAHYHKRQFDPWGGKRGSIGDEEWLHDAVKRQFSPWGGKRSLSQANHIEEDSSLLKKRNFGAWGGKKSDNSLSRFDDRRDLDSSDGKRSFGVWGGNLAPDSSLVKLDADTLSNMKSFHQWENKRSFNAWGGKRNGVSQDKNAWTLLVPKAQRNFNAWGGKRYAGSANSPVFVLSREEMGANYGDDHDSHEE